MALSLTNTCEGTNGAALAASSIGAPNAFNSSTKSGTGTTATFDSTQFHTGSTSVLFSMANVSSTDYVDWTSATITTATANAYLRFYVYLTANPTANTRVAAFIGTGSLNASLQLTTGGLLRTVNSAGGVVATMTGTIPLNTWTRIEFEIVGQSGTTGTINARIYTGESSTTITGGTLTNSAQTTSANLTNDARIGLSSAVTMTSTWTIWYDDMAFSDTAQPGPMATDATVTGVIVNVPSAAPAGVVSTDSVLAGAVATASAVAPAGGLSSLTTGAVATTAVTAPVGSVTISGGVTLSGVVATTAVAARVGSVTTGTSVTVTGVVATSAVAAPAGVTVVTVVGVPATATVVTPAGSLVVGVTLAGTVTATTIAAPAGTIVIGNAVLVAVVADMQPGSGVNAPPDVVGKAVRNWNPDYVIMPGDLANDGTTAQYGFFDEMYGATVSSAPAPYNTPTVNLKAKVYPTPGNHDWGNTTNIGLGNYDTYWGSQARAGNTVPRWYSFDIPVGSTSWHVISIDSNNSSTSNIMSNAAPTSGTTAYNWVSADLAANTGKPTILFCHQPRWSDGTATGTGGTGDNAAGLGDLWTLCRTNNVELWLVGHCHSYQRFPKWDASGAADAGGIREIVVGTGGSGLHTLNATQRSTVNSYQSAAYDQLNSQWFGYMQLTLTPTSYSWAFISQNGSTLDSGTQATNIQPPVTLTGTVAIATVTAPAGVVTLPKTVAGPVATCSSTAPAGTVGIGRTVSGVTATCSSSAPAGTASVDYRAQLLARTDLLYGSEIGAWEVDGMPAVSVASGIPATVKAARINLIRFALYDVFTDLLDPTGAAGTETRANYNAAVSGIVSNLAAVPMMKLVPIAPGVIGTKTGTIFCPNPGTANWDMNLPFYKAILSQSGSQVAIYESNNEMEYDCYAAWGYASSGTTGVSTNIGKHWSANMPALRKYARTLGFDIVTMGYFGSVGGFGWGDSIASPRTGNFAEFMTATYNAYVASGNDPDYIPDVLSFHAYPYSGDFGYSATLSDIIAYYDALIPALRTVAVSTWGSTIGNRFKFAISEWNCGDNAWPGWGTSAVTSFINSFMPMMQRNNIWQASIFAIASNPSENYDIIKADNSTTLQYSAFKSVSLAAQAQAAGPPATTTVSAPAGAVVTQRTLTLAGPLATATALANAGTVQANRSLAVLGVPGAVSVSAPIPNGVGGAVPPHFLGTSVVTVEVIGNATLLVVAPMMSTVTAVDGTSTPAPAVGTATVSE